MNARAEFQVRAPMSFFVDTGLYYITVRVEAFDRSVSRDDFIDSDDVLCLVINNSGKVAGSGAFDSIFERLKREAIKEWNAQAEYAQRERERGDRAD